MRQKTGGVLFAAGWSIVSLMSLSGLLLVTSCGGGGGSSGGGGGVDYDYSVSLSPDKTMVAPGGTVNLNLHLDAPANNAGVTWKLACEQADCGSVSPTAVYTAPGKVDEQIAVGISATSKDNPSKGYYVQIWITGKIVVRINANNLLGLNVNQTAQFTARVNSPDTAVTWQVNGVAGGNSTVGTISAAGLYTAPAQVPDPFTVQVGAVAHVDSSASCTVPVQIWAAAQVIVSISPEDGSVPVGTTLQFTANVLNATDTTVKWQVNGIEGGNSTIGTISTGGLFTAPSVIPAPAQETITAVSHADSTKYASTSVTIVALHNSLLNGSYAFELSGSDGSGKMAAMIGSLIADGNGKLHGLLDMNGVASTVAQTAVQFTGTYAIGAQNMGYMFLNLSPQLTLAFTMNSDGNDAKLIEYDTRGTRYAGSLHKQDSNLSWTKFVGYYVLSCYGTTKSGERITAIGRFQAVSGGTINNASVYIKEQGHSVEAVQNQTGEFDTTHDTYGRGFFGLTESGSTVAYFSYYMINGGDLLFMSLDPVPEDNPLFVGRMLSQDAGPWSYGALQGASVFSLAGVMPADSSKSTVVAGHWTSPGTGSSLSAKFDLNAGGQISTAQSFTATYTIDVTGWGTMSSNEFLYKSLIFYMIDENKAFLMQSNGDDGLIGMAEPQAQISTFDNSLFSGTYRIGPISVPRPGGSISQGILVADGSGTFWAGENILDLSAITETFSGNYSVDAAGRTEVTFTSPETFHYVAYPVSAKRFVGISIEPNDSKPNVTGLDQ